MKLQRLRQSKNMGISELARKAGVAYSTIANIESGAVAPRRSEVMRKIAAALEVPPQMIDEFQRVVGTPDVLVESAEVR